MPERENPPMIWFKIGNQEGVISEYRGFFEWEEVINKIKPLVSNDGKNFLRRSSLAGHALECNEFQGVNSIYLYWGDEFGKMEHSISDGEIGMLNTAVFQGISTLAMQENNITLDERNTMIKIQVPVRFEGHVTVEVPYSLATIDRRLLAEKLALARVVATTDNPDAPETEAFEEYQEAASVAAKRHADIDWDGSSAAPMSVGGSWCLIGEPISISERMVTVDALKVGDVVDMKSCPHSSGNHEKIAKQRHWVVTEINCDPNGIIEVVYGEGGSVGYLPEIKLSIQRIVL